MCDVHVVGTPRDVDRWACVRSEGSCTRVCTLRSNVLYLYNVPIYPLDYQLSKPRRLVPSTLGDDVLYGYTVPLST